MARDLAIDAIQASRLAASFPVALARRHIAENFSDPSISLGSVSAACGLSRSHFSRLFKHCVGVGFRDYLRGVRLQEAKRLLESSALSVKEVAASVGFVHTSDLDRHMKRSKGTTPSELRSSAQARLLVNSNYFQQIATASNK
jgi:AraC family transcriptional regulator